MHGTEWDNRRYALPSLAIHHTYYITFFAFYSVAPEPSTAAATKGLIQLTLTPQYELAVVHKAGGLPLAPGVLMGAVQVAASRARELEARLDVRVREELGVEEPIWLFLAMNDNPTCPANCVPDGQDPPNCRPKQKVTHDKVFKNRL
jgi:hypothetical protein